MGPFYRQATECRAVFRLDMVQVDSHHRTPHLRELPGQQLPRRRPADNRNAWI
jgi:hypothetical protein